jgi:prenyltransferase beta subunit
MKLGIEAFLSKRLWGECAFVEVGERIPTLEATRFGMEAAIRSGLDLVVSESARSWVRTLWSPEGGFASDSEALRPDLASSYYAVRLLLTTRDRTVLDEIRPALTRWLIEQWDKPYNRNVDTVYYLVRAVKLLESPVERDVSQSWREFLWSCQDRLGGFGKTPGSAPDIERTYCATHLLLLLGEPISNLTAHWLQECVELDGWIIWSPTDSRRSHGTLYWGSHLALLIEAERRWDSPQLVEKTQNSDGGFGFNGSSLWDTYCAVSADLIAKIALGTRTRAALCLE